MNTVKINTVKSNPNNPRLIKDDKFKKLVKSLREFPEMAKVRPIVVNQDMVVLGGNMRLKGMKEAGWKDVPIEIVDWSEDKQREFIIKDNVGFGEWEWELLANEWDAEDLEEWGLDGFPFENVADESKDLSDYLRETFEVIIECTSEREQEQVFNSMIKDGYKCRVLTL